MAKKILGEDVASKKLLAVVHGMKIYSDSVYVIVGKQDESAPDGFQDRQISKTPFAGNKSIVSCSWDKYLGVYDTGFFQSSACYRGLGTEEKNAEVRRRVDNIMKPYEESTGEDLRQDNFTFWDNLTVDNYEKRLFDTNNIHDLFDLYVSIQSKMLTPKEEDGNPEFINSMYCVEDSTTTVDVRRQRSVDKSEINFAFISALRGSAAEKEQIIDLLIYLDIISIANQDDSMIQYVFTSWLDKKGTNVDLFKDSYNRFINDDSSRGTDIIKYHRIVKEMAYAGKINSSTMGYVFNGETLGADYITSAMNLVDDKSMAQTRVDLLAAYAKLKKKHSDMVSGKKKEEKEEETTE